MHASPQPKHQVRLAEVLVDEAWKLIVATTKLKLRPTLNQIYSITHSSHLAAKQGYKVYAFVSINMIYLRFYSQTNKKLCHTKKQARRKKLVSRFKTINQTGLRYDPVIKIARQVLYSMLIC